MNFSPIAQRADHGATSRGGLLAKSPGTCGLQQEGEEPYVIESCHSTWIFDVANRRFRRMVKGRELKRRFSTDWRLYDHVVFDSESGAFLIFLDALGTRVLRSQRHSRRCERCGDSTATICVDDLKREIAKADGQSNPLTAESLSHS